MKFLSTTNELNPKETCFECFHDIKDVISGKVPEQQDSLWMGANKYRYGFGNGALDDIKGIGEAILINGVVYTQSTYPAPEKYSRLFFGTKFLTSWMFNLSSLSKAPTILTNEDEEMPTPRSIMEIYDIIFEKLKKPFFIAGVANFLDMQGSAIAKAPIDNKNIFENENIYYPNTIKKTDVCAAMVGVIANINTIEDIHLSKSMKKVVYYNPLADKKTDLTTHEHVLILNKKVTRIEHVTSEDAVEVNHLFSNSLVTNFHFNIYEIDKIHEVI